MYSEEATSSSVVFQKQLPTVSAVIPAYNAAETIERALDSVYAQTYGNINEVIVVDDGSEDNTANILREKYPDVILIQQQNAGVGAARNRAIEAATGEYIAFLDADDEWLPGKVERQMETLLAKPEIDFCGCLLEIHTQGGRRARPYPEAFGETVELTFASYLGREYPPITVTPIGTRSALVSSGGYDPTMPAFEDLDMWLRVLASGYNIVILQEYLHRWYIQDESLCHGRGGLRKHEAVLRILDKWDPMQEPKAREFLTREEHVNLKRRALLTAAVDHARYGEYEEAQDYAKQGLEIAGPSLRDRFLLRALAKAPLLHGICARAAAAGKNCIRRLLR